jgi:hypothetical protein
MKLTEPTDKQRSELLSCPFGDCKSLIFDGTAIGPSANLFTDKDYFEPKQMPTNGMRKTVSGRSQRRLIYEMEGRKMLVKLAHLKRAYGKDVVGKVDLTVEEYSTLISVLKESNYGLSRATADFLKDVTYEENGLVHAPNFLLPFLNELGLEYSSSFGFLQLPSTRCRKIVSLICTMPGSILPKKDILDELRQFCPLVYNVFCKLGPTNAKTFKKVLFEIFKSYTKSLENNHWFESEANVGPCSQDHLIITGRDKCRLPRTYLQSNQQGAHELQGLGDCKKIPTPIHHAQLFTGICEHSYIQIATPMLQAESPRFLFYILLCYWKKPPKYIIYDNACHASEYCANREPDFFKDSIFCIDKFHYRNHTACTRSFDSKLYSEANAMNSQVCEQFNRDLNCVSNSIQYAGIDTYKVMITTFMLIKNFRRRNNLPT